ncbi:hypothetical protein SUDANB121_04683 [Nocardiopsis dassonvillei]
MSSGGGSGLLERGRSPGARTAGPSPARSGRGAGPLRLRLRGLGRAPVAVTGLGWTTARAPRGARPPAPWTASTALRTPVRAASGAPSVECPGRPTGPGRERSQRPCGPGEPARPPRSRAGAACAPGEPVRRTDPGGRVPGMPGGTAPPAERSPRARRRGRRSRATRRDPARGRAGHSPDPGGTDLHRRWRRPAGTRRLRPRRGPVRADRRGDRGAGCRPPRPRNDHHRRSAARPPASRPDTPHPPSAEGLRLHYSLLLYTSSQRY